MNALVVLAHPEPRSFCGALRDVAVQTLQAEGHVIEQSDLYAMRWQPLLRPQDFPLEGDDTPFNAQHAQRAAVAGGYQPGDVVVEQTAGRSRPQRTKDDNFMMMLACPNL